ncbi:hypothetical protein RvY_02462 [Ramazzottius varieornatus]|uniref:Phospholipid scramblase n=1 Tax=Ramazzottius varieornatus TaxID=947166 RepID=A0A1D1UUX9_RAMVA|nr:hypothetical protein RvY_02462 [Ramazzottius varieornatus]
MYQQPGVQYGQPGMMMPTQPMMAPSGPAMTGLSSMMTYPPVSWMPAPPPIPGVPHGLEYLNTLDRLSIRQQIEMLESQYSSEMEIQAPTGNAFGFIEQEWTLWVPKFRIMNANRETVLRVEGPCCTVACCGEVEFSIVTPTDGVEIGKLSKKWSGFVQEAFTDADNFAIYFPVDLDVHTKATLLGLTFLIDFMFFERAANRENSPAARTMGGGRHGHGGMHGAGMHAPMHSHF